MLLPKSAVRNSKQLKFIKKQEVRGVLSNLLGIKVTILIDILVLNTLF